MNCNSGTLCIYWSGCKYVALINRCTGTGTQDAAEMEKMNTCTYMALRMISGQAMIFVSGVLFTEVTAPQHCTLVNIRFIIRLNEN